MPEKPFALTQNTPAQPQAEDYDAIHSAVMETSRGNWFLTEFARRNRNADTALVLAAIKRIESAMRNQTAIPAQSHAADQAAPAQDQLSAALGHQLHELRDAIALTKESLPEIAADGRIALRNADFSRIAAGIERVAARMRASAEQAAQTAQSLRERAHKEFGIEKDALDRRASELDAQAQDLSTFCTQLDEQIESARMVATLLAEIEAQLDGMIARQKTAPPEPRVINPAPPPPAPEPPAAVAEPLPVAEPQPVAYRPPPAPPEPVAISAPPPPQAEAAVIAPSPAAPDVPQPEPVAIQPEPEPAVIEPAPEAGAPPDNGWMENFAPPVHVRYAADTPADVDVAEEAKPTIALPNPAAREVADAAPAPMPPKPEEPLAAAAPAAPPRIAEPPVADTPIVPRIKVMPQATVPATPEPVRVPKPDVAKPDAALPPQSATSDDPTDFLFEPLPPAPQPQPALATNGAAANAKPTPPPTRPADPLAPIMALSDEEKIALFS
jgi:hypothetical protein